jgi:hypothetical protein
MDEFYRKKPKKYQKTASEIRESFANLIAHNLPKLDQDLQTLSPRDRLRIISDLARYVLPTFRSVEVSPESSASFSPFVISINRTNDTTNEPFEEPGGPGGNLLS